jgi:hypothetical protein
MKLYKEWHLIHPMPINPSLMQRIDWHIDHIKHCSCQDISGKCKEKTRRRNEMDCFLRSHLN